MSQFEFVFTLPTGVKIRSDLRGWQIEIETWEQQHSTAVFALSHVDHLPFRMFCLNCWPLPIHKRFKIDQLTYTVRNDEQLSIADRDFEILCATFYLYVGPTSFATINIDSLIFKPHGAAYSGSDMKWWEFER